MMQEGMEEEAMKEEENVSCAICATFGGPEALVCRI